MMSLLPYGVRTVGLLKLGVTWVATSPISAVNQEAKEVSKQQNQLRTPKGNTQKGVPQVLHPVLPEPDKLGHPVLQPAAGENKVRVSKRREWGRLAHQDASQMTAEGLRTTPPPPAPCFPSPDEKPESRMRRNFSQGDTASGNWKLELRTLSLIQCWPHLAVLPPWLRSLHKNQLFLRL